MTRRAVERALSAGVVALGLAGAYWLHVYMDIEWKPESLRDYVAALGLYGPLVVVAIMTFRPFLGLPMWVALILCGVLFGPWLGAAYGTIGTLLGGVLIFGIARSFGRDAVQSRIGGALRLFDDLLASRGVPWLALYAAVPVAPLTPVFASAGVSRMRLSSFCAGIGIGIVPRASVFTFAGEAAVERSATSIGVAALLIVAAAGITWLLRHSFRSP
ncbi:MAG: VTT domain-containing protein [Myxococcota bacterium]